MSNAGGYDTERIQSAEAIRYFFVSRGKEAVIKTIQYYYLQEFLGRRLYNLGFGDYNLATDTVSDDVDSNNGDVYAVFHTVLRTIPDFFEIFPEAILVVRGSDSGSEFETRCRRDCKRGCAHSCKKLNRRIRAYREYVNRNFSAMNLEYTFYGRMDSWITGVVERYEPGKDYTAVFLHKR